MYGRGTCLVHIYGAWICMRLSGSPLTSRLKGRLYVSGRRRGSRMVSTSSHSASMSSSSGIIHITVGAPENQIACRTGSVADVPSYVLAARLPVPGPPRRIVTVSILPSSGSLAGTSDAGSLDVAGWNDQTRMACRRGTRARAEQYSHLPRGVCYSCQVSASCGHLRYVCCSIHPIPCGLI